MSRQNSVKGNPPPPEKKIKQFQSIPYLLQAQPALVLQSLACYCGSWLVGCFGFNGPLRQYFSLYRAVSQREGERGEKGQMRVKMSKQPPPASTASAVGPCPTVIQFVGRPVLRLYNNRQTQWKLCRPQIHRFLMSRLILVCTVCPDDLSENLRSLRLMILPVKLLCISSGTIILFGFNK